MILYHQSHKRMRMSVSILIEKVRDIGELGLGSFYKNWYKRW